MFSDPELDFYEVFQAKTAEKSKEGKDEIKPTNSEDTDISETDLEDEADAENGKLEDSVNKNNSAKPKPKTTPKSSKKEETSKKKEKATKTQTWWKPPRHHYFRPPQHPKR